MITPSIESNYLHIEPIESILVNRGAQVPLCAVRLRVRRKRVYSLLDRAYMDNILGSDAVKRLTKVASIGQWWHGRLMSALNNHYTRSLTYQPICPHMTQGKKPCNTRFTFLDNEPTLQRCWNASSSRLDVALRTRPHPD